MGSYGKNNFDYFVKIILIGESDVGKSNIMSRFKKNKFNLEFKCTGGAHHATRKINVNNKVFKAQIWDVGGHERYRWKYVLDSAYEGVAGALIVYYITSMVTFQHVERWLKELRDHTCPYQKLVIMLVGNKANLHHQRSVQTEDAMAFSERENIFFMETSALESLNVDNAFTKVLTQIYYNVFNEVHHIGNNLSERCMLLKNHDV